MLMCRLVQTETHVFGFCIVLSGVKSAPHFSAIFTQFRSLVYLAFKLYVREFPGTESDPDGDEE